MSEVLFQEKNTVYVILCAVLGVVIIHTLFDFVKFAVKIHWSTLVTKIIVLFHFENKINFYFHLGPNYDKFMLTTCDNSPAQSIKVFLSPWQPPQVLIHSIVFHVVVSEDGLCQRGVLKGYMKICYSKKKCSPVLEALKFCLEKSFV